MKSATVLFLLATITRPASADFKSTNDVTVTGQVGVQTFVPRARFEIQMSTVDSYGLKVSSSDGTALLAIDNMGRLGIGTLWPQSMVDVRGSGDNGAIGMWLRSGNSTSTTLSSQIAFGLASTDTYRHSIRTRHTSGQNALNAIDFFLWNSTGQPGVLGSQNVLTIQGSLAASSMSVHVDPFGQPDVELEVSNGLATGGGTIVRGAAGVHSSRALKSDVSYLGENDEEQAFADVKALRHVRFRYRTSPGASQMPLMRGLIYEDSPPSVRGPHQTIIFDYRLANLEMALKEINRQADSLEAEIARLEDVKRRKK